MKTFIKKIDIAVLEFFEKSRRPSWLDRIFVVCTKMGDYGFVWFVLVIVLYFLGDQHIYISLLLLTSILSVIVISEGMFKFIFRRNRPFDTHLHLIPPIKKPKSFSFPSGHTAMSFSAFVIMLLLEKQHMWLVALVGLLALMISFSRMYLRVHYPSDVLAGAMVGSTIAVVICEVFGKVVVG